MTIATFTLRSAATQANAPFCLGHAFKRGDVPAGSQMVGSISDLQVTPQTTWPDGSLKFAIVAGRAALTGGTPLSVTLSLGTPAAGTALALADLKATAVTASIDASAFGTVSWATTDWDGAFKEWVAGPKMSSWIYRKAVGADAHLVGWLEVRLWSGGEVEVLPWIENGYLNVASPINKSATYVFTLGGTQRMSAVIDLKHHQRTPVISGAELAYWLGTDPGVTPLADAAYLQASELVPTYRAVMAAGASRVAAQPTTFAPLQQGSFNYASDSMPSSGYQTPIGLLPEHDVLYLVANAADRAALYASVVRNGYSAGRYAIHFRDETTQRPPAFSAYPTLVLNGGQDHGIKDTGASTTSTYTPVPTGGSGPTWDLSHSPSVGYMAYLLTGRFYFKEEVQFAATANHFCITDYMRGGGGHNGYNPAPGYTGAAGICTGLSVQLRSGAWWFRTLTQALAATPDSGDPLRSELITCVENNCNFFHGIYVAQANNQLGVVEDPYPSYGLVPGHADIAIWQQDFVAGAWGMALSLGLPIGSTAATKMSAFFAWKSSSIVGRLGTSAGWNYINASVYTMPVSTVTPPDYYGGTGPWDTFKQAYDAKMAAYGGEDGAISTTDGVLGMGFPQASDPGMWHNLQPAIAYAVRHGVTGAQAAYDRMTAASNWSSIQPAFNLKPVWSIQPAFSGVSTLTTPGPSFIWDTAPLIAGAFVWGTHRGHGITAAEIPTGFADEALLLKHVLVGANAASEYRWHADTVPAGLTFNINENSSFDASAADGVYNGTKTVYTDGAGDPGTYSFTFGATSHTLTGAASTQANSSGTGVIGQVHVLTGAASAQANAASTGVLTQVHELVGAASVQTNNSTVGALSSSIQTLIGAPCSQANASGTGAITQLYNLTGAACVQANIAAAGAVTLSHDLSALASTQTNAASAAAVTQAHALVAAASVQQNQAAAAAISQLHVLVGAPSTQVNESFVGALDAGIQILSGAPSSQANASAAGAISQAHALAGVGAVQANSCLAAAVSIEINLVGASSTQANTCAAADVVITHDLAGLDCTQRNQSLGSAVTGNHVLLGTASLQINLSSVANLTGRVTIRVAPDNQTFRFKPSNDSGHIPGW